ncbi:hypothetical protein ROHU_031187 [Labeo rohita]|uniref:Uncharacterized protein n=1 Tax=Labeo rohita TaxID=84645 RepID=A0A498LX57_LABRO|nr:hypothetical protein ROHU_031187 [Labeo rohita]
MSSPAAAYHYSRPTSPDRDPHAPGGPNILFPAPRRTQTRQAVRGRSPEASPLAERNCFCALAPASEGSGCQLPQMTDLQLLIFKKTSSLWVSHDYTQHINLSSSVRRQRKPAKRFRYTIFRTESAHSNGRERVDAPAHLKGKTLTLHHTMPSCRTAGVSADSDGPVLFQHGN